MRPHRRPNREGSASAVPASPPELLLVCEAWSTTLVDGRWRFTLESLDGPPLLEAEDEEPGDLNRLTLLAAVRGLESIDGPASLTLLSDNRYLIRSLADSLPRWRENDFVWEHFGRLIDIQHADLWRRIDRALRIHRVEACLVSRRLVSVGAAAGENPAGGTPRADAPARSVNGPFDRQLRVDSPHGPPPGRPASSGERLRRWVLGRPPANPPGDGQPARGRHRFTSADLLETT